MPKPVVGILINNVESDYSASILKAIYRRAVELDVSTMTFAGGAFNSANNLETFGNFLFDLADSREVDGMILFAGSLSSKHGIETFSSYISQYRPMPYVALSALVPGIPSILVDNYEGMRKVVEHLVIDHGYRKLGYCRKSVLNYEANERWRAFCDVLAEHNIPLDDRLIIPPEYYFTMEAGISLLLDKRGVRPGIDMDVMVVTDDWAVSNMSLVLEQRGMKVPDDFRLTGFDLISTYSVPFELTATAQPLGQMGNIALDLILARIRGEPVADCTLLPPRLGIGCSCGCPDSLHDWLQPTPEFTRIADTKHIHDPEFFTGIIKYYQYHMGPIIVEQALVLAKMLSEDFLTKRSRIHSQFVNNFNKFLDRYRNPDANGDRRMQLKELDDLEHCFNYLMGTLNSMGFGNKDRVYLGDLIGHARAELIIIKSNRQIHYHQIRQGIDQKVHSTVQRIYAADKRQMVLDQLTELATWLEIPNLALCTFDDTTLNQSSLRLAIRHGIRLPGPDKGTPIDENWLLPPDLGRSLGRFNILVTPLFNRSKPMGYLCLEVAMSYWEDLFMFETVRLVVSGTLYSTQLIEEIDLARQNAEIANRSKSDFLARMSHELRTPLNGILGFADILMRDPSLDDSQSESVEIIARSGEHLLSLINDLLDFSKIEAQRFELYLRPVAFRPFINDIMQIIRTRAQEKRLNFEFEMSGPAPDTVVVDDKRLRQILLNLLSNAVKFTTRGKVSFKVHIEDAIALDPDDTRMNAKITFFVTDTGPGIEPDVIGRLFKPFEQAGDIQSRSGGTGLGLAISQQLAQLMGSRIHAESTVGSGSTFRVTLTMPMISGTPLGTLDNAKATQIVSYAGMHRTILVVDDNETNRKVLVNTLEPLGFTVIEAADGMSALTLSASVLPDIVLVDMYMPGLSGIETVQQLRQTPGGNALAIIMISASVGEDNRRLYLDAGCDGFLPKPFAIAELFGMLAETASITWVEGDPQARPPKKVKQIVPSNGSNAIPPKDELDPILELAHSGKLLRIRDTADRLWRDRPEYALFLKQISSCIDQFDAQGIIDLIIAKNSSRSGQ